MVVTQIQMFAGKNETVKQLLSEMDEMDFFKNRIQKYHIYKMDMLKRTRVPYSRYREIMTGKFLSKRETEEEEDEEEEDEEEDSYEDDFKLDDEEESIYTRVENANKRKRLGAPSEPLNKRQNFMDPHEACRTSILALKEKLKEKTMESMGWERKCMENYSTIQSKNETIKNLRFLNEELQATVINGFDAIKDMIQNNKNTEKRKEVISTVNSKTDTKIKIETADGPSEIKLENLENEADDDDFRDFNDPLE